MMSVVLRAQGIKAGNYRSLTDFFQMRAPLEREGDDGWEVRFQGAKWVNPLVVPECMDR